MNMFYDSLKNRCIGIVKDEPLKNHTTFKIGGNAAYFVTPSDASEIAYALSEAEKYGIRTLIMGNGSNMLISDKGFDGAVIFIGEKMGSIELIGENTVKAGAGALLVKVCNEALSASLTGMENLYGIPGSVGGCLYMNAGAYGSEMKDVVVSCEYIDKNGNICSVNTDEMELSYRKSVFCETESVIVSVTFSLKKGEKDSIRSKMEECMRKRRDKQPLEYPSAGSVFKRPQGHFAGALIEQCGLKGKNIGGAQVSEKHAGFIINTGNATQSDVSALIELCKKTVFENTGVQLETEIKVFE